MSIATLTDTQQPIFTAGAMLFRCQSQGGRHLPAIGKLPRITHSGNQCCRDHRTDTAKLLQSLCNRVALSNHVNLMIKLSHTPIQGCQIIPQATLRALAFKWIRILYRCWEALTPYDEIEYLRSLERRGSPLLEQFATSK